MPSLFYGDERPGTERHRLPPTTYRAVLRYRVYQTWGRDRFTVFWRCDHLHATRDAAHQCSLEELARRTTVHLARQTAALVAAHREV